jgi:hypothetical protein
MKSTVKPAIPPGAAMSLVVWGLAQGHDDNCSNEALKGAYRLSISGTRPATPAAKRNSQLRSRHHRATHRRGDPDIRPWGQFHASYLGNAQSRFHNAAATIL